jgi:hypothetical protein
MNEDRIKACITRHPDWTDRQVSKSLGLRLLEVEADRQLRRGGAVLPGETIYPGHPKAEAAQAGPAAPSGGFSLRGIRLLSKKPADCMKARLYALRRGMGYKIESLSKEWGISADTIRKHAKDHNALVYVEATPGEYVACVVHPETPKGE